MLFARVLLIVAIFLFTGCFDSEKSKNSEQDILQEKKAKLDEEIQKARLEADKKRELALTKMKKELEELALKQNIKKAELQQRLAQIEAQKELEIQKIQKELKLKELEIQKERMRLEMENQKLIAKEELKAKEQLYLLLIGAFLILLMFIGIVLYIYKKRKDKILAYHDNLEKYFRLKENESKIAIANKIIDTIASGKLSPEQEQRLISVLKSPENIDKKELPKDIKDNETIVAELEDKEDKKDG